MLLYGIALGGQTQSLREFQEWAIDLVFEYSCWLFLINSMSFVVLQTKQQPRWASTEIFLATSWSPSVNLQRCYALLILNSRKGFCCSSTRFSILNCLVTALNARFHFSSSLAAILFSMRKQETVRRTIRPRTIMTDGTVNTLSGAV